MIVRSIELENIEDLAYLASSSPFGATIMHFKDDLGDLYFMIGGTRRETIVYYVRQEEIPNRFINLNVTKGTKEYTDLPILNPNVKVIPIIKVKAQDLFKLEK
jgi:hypothetical protein